MGLLSALGLLTAQARSGQPAVADAKPSPPAQKAGPIGSPVATKSEAELKELAKWPAEAHTAWKKLTTLDRTGVLEAMSKRYGKPFAQDFLKFTKGGQRLEQAHYVTALAHQTPAWFESKGYKLAQRSTYQEWWVHPNGHVVYLVLESTPKELKDALDQVLKAIEKSDADFGDIVVTLEIPLGPNPVGPPADPLETFNQYVERLDKLKAFVDAAMAAARKARADLVKKGIGTSELDEQVGKLADTRQRVDKKLEQDHLDELDPAKSN